MPNLLSNINHNCQISIVEYTRTILNIYWCLKLKYNGYKEASWTHTLLGPFEFKINKAWLYFAVQISYMSVLWEYNSED